MECNDWNLISTRISLILWCLIIDVVLFKAHRVQSNQSAVVRTKRNQTTSIFDPTINHTTRQI